MELKFNKNAKVLFVCSSGNAEDSSKLMMLSYVKMVQLFKTTENVKFISAVSLSSLEMSTTSIYVVEDTSSFENFASTRSIVIGPGTILSCQLGIVETATDSSSNSAGKSTSQSITSTVVDTVASVRDDSIPESEELTSGEQETIDRSLFVGLVFMFSGFSPDITLELTRDIMHYGGTVVQKDYSPKVIDYLIVPTELTPGHLNYLGYVLFNIRGRVTDFWLEDCLSQNRLVDVKYYHRPIYLQTDSAKPLLGWVVVLSTYTGYEREYLWIVARSLGAEVNDRFERRQKPILVCPAAFGKKYQAAIEWKLPAVSCEWLMKCFEQMSKVPMAPYGVGLSDCSENEERRDVKAIKSNGEQENTTPIKRRRLDDELPSIASVKETPPDILKLIHRSSDVVPKHTATLNEHRKRRLCKKRFDDEFDVMPPPPVRALSRSDRSDSLNDQTSTPGSNADDSVRRDSSNGQSSDPESSANVDDAARSGSSNSQSSDSDYSVSTDMKSDSTSSENVEDAQTNSNGTQTVREFILSIQKCRSDYRRTPVEVHISSESDDELLTNGESLNNDTIDYREPADVSQSSRNWNESISRFKGQMCFSLSPTFDAERQRLLTEQIVQLGGTVCQDFTKFDAACTHFVASKLVGSEKELSIIASGRWLLCPAYIADSFKAGHFLDEEDYEWGNPTATSDFPETANKIALASHRWRKELEKSERRPVGVFSGFVALFHSNESESFERVLKAGCGTVVGNNRQELCGITHCFADKSLPDTEKAEMKMMAAYCVTTEYIRACLLLDDFPKIEDYEAS